MELKLLSLLILLHLLVLLIVPYGIETGVGECFKKRVKLLIVPYGIETGW